MLHLRSQPVLASELLQCVVQRNLIVRRNKQCSVLPQLAQARDIAQHECAAACGCFQYREPERLIGSRSGEDRGLLHMCRELWSRQVAEPRKVGRIRAEWLRAWR